MNSSTQCSKWNKHAWSQTFQSNVRKDQAAPLRHETRRIPARRIPGRPGSQNEVRAKAAQPRSRSFIGWVRARALTCRSARARILRTCTFARPRARDTALCTSPRASPIRERLDQLAQARRKLHAAHLIFTQIIILLKSSEVMSLKSSKRKICPRQAHDSGNSDPAVHYFAT